MTSAERQILDILQDIKAAGSGGSTGPNLTNMASIKSATGQPLEINASTTLNLYGFDINIGGDGTVDQQTMDVWIGKFNHLYIGGHWPTMPSAAANAMIYIARDNDHEFNSSNDIVCEAAVTANNPMEHIIQRARGTLGSKSAILNGDDLGGWRCNGFTGSAFVQAVKFKTLVAEPVGFSAGNCGVSWALQTCAIGSGTLVDRIAIDGSGNTTISGKLTAAYDGDNYTKIAAALGSAIKAETFPFNRMTTGSTPLTDNAMMVRAIYLSTPQVLTGIKWRTVVVGSFTADQNNRIGLYSYSGGTCTLVASCANDATLYQTGLSDAIVTKAFSSVTATLPAGLYFIGALYNSSAVVTGPTISITTAMANAAVNTLDFSNSAVISGSLAAQNDLPSSFAMSSVSGSTAQPWFALY